MKNIHHLIYFLPVVGFWIFAFRANQQAMSQRRRWAILIWYMITWLTFLFYT